MNESHLITYSEELTGEIAREIGTLDHGMNGITFTTPSLCAPRKYSEMTV
jgi:hypothetical protein